MSKKSQRQSGKKSKTSKSSTLESEDFINEEVLINELLEQSIREESSDRFDSSYHQDQVNNRKRIKSICGRPTYRQDGNKIRNSVEGTAEYEKYITDRKSQRVTVTEGVKSKNGKSKVVSGNSYVEYSSKLFFTHFKLILLILVICLVIVGNKFHAKDMPQNLRSCIQSIKNKYPKQDEMLWKAIITGINGTVESQTPSTYIFLHKAEAEKTLKNLIDEMSRCIVCQLSDCDIAAVHFEEEVQKLPEIDDYGKVLTHLKSKLEKSGLLIVNLATLPEKFALAFHNICDEITPLVNKLAVFFTFEMDSFEKSPLYDSVYIEDLLKKKWKTLKEDEFDPLWTRMSNMLLRVVPDN